MKLCSKTQLKDLKIQKFICLNILRFLFIYLGKKSYSEIYFVSCIPLLSVHQDIQKVIYNIDSGALF